MYAVNRLHLASRVQLQKLRRLVGLSHLKVTRHINLGTNILSGDQPLERVLQSPAETVISSDNMHVHQNSGPCMHANGHWR